MRKPHLSNRLLLSLILLSSSLLGLAQRKVEILDRSLVALYQTSSSIYVGWRFLGSDIETTRFNLYHSTDNSHFSKVNTAPMYTTDTLLSVTNFPSTQDHWFAVKAVNNGVESQMSLPFKFSKSTPVRKYVQQIALKAPPVPSGKVFNIQVGDADGDGQYEMFVLNHALNSGSDTVSMWLDCYTLLGDWKWRFHFGPNINMASEHNAQAFYTVYDFDGCGKAEVIVRASELSTFNLGQGTKYQIPGKVWPRNGGLQPLGAPEYLCVINAETGQMMDKIDYQPAMGASASMNTTWGGNERPFYQWHGVAYLDGKFPSLVCQRGIGEGFKVAVYAFDYRKNSQGVSRLSMRPQYYSSTQNIAFGGHSWQLKDIDNDGKDEIQLCATAIDHDMTLKYNMGDKRIGHGDMFAVADLDPDRPGLEWFAVTQGEPVMVGSNVWEAATGNVIRSYIMNAPGDPSRGDAAPLLVGVRGAQTYGPTVIDRDGYSVGPVNFTTTTNILWDGDNARELLSNRDSYRKPEIQKYSAGGGLRVLLDFASEGTGNQSMWGVSFIGDLYGDWRDEVIVQTSDLNYLRIYTTTIKAQDRYPTMMQNPSYRAQLTCQGRTGGTNPDFYFGPTMVAVPPCSDAFEDLTWNGNSSVWNNTSTNFVNRERISTAYSNGKRILFDDYGIDGTNSGSTTVTLSENYAPAWVHFYNYKPYNLSGNGSLSGTMGLTKRNAGNVTIESSMTFTGKTEVWDGTLVINGNYNSPITVYGGVWGGVAAKLQTGGQLAGKGIINAPVTILDGGAIVGKGPEPLRLQQGLTIGERGILGVEIVSLASSEINITGDLTMENGSCIYVEGNPSAGKFMLAKYSGTFNGDLAKINVKGLEGVLYTLKTDNGELYLDIQSQPAFTSIVWNGKKSVWDLGITQSWKKGNDDTVFHANDSVTIVSEQPNQNIQLWGVLPVSDINIDVKGRLTLTDGDISGTNKMTKTGFGTLLMTGNHSFSGNILHDQGTIEIQATQIIPNQNSVLGNNDGSSDKFQMTNSTLLFNGKSNQYMGRGVTISGKDTIEVGSSAAMISGKISGSGTLVKRGSGRLALAAATNSYTGGTIIEEGDLLAAYCNNPLGTGPITIKGGAAFVMNDTQGGNAENFNNNIIVPEGETARWEWDGRSLLNGTLTGSGTLTVYSPYVRTDLKGNWNNFTGKIIVEVSSKGGDFRVNNSYGLSNATVLLTGKTTAYHVSNSTVKYGMLNSSETTTKVATPIIVGSNNQNGTFSGLIQGSGTVSKLGTGSWELTGTNTYTGTTTVQDGNLIISGSGSTGNGAVNITGGKVSGKGTINGNVSVLSTGRIAPGSETTSGTLTLNTSLTIKKGGILAINISTFLASKINVTGNITLESGAKLELCSLAASYRKNQPYTIMQFGTLTGTFAEIIPAKPAPDLKWDTSELYTKGIIMVVEDPSSVPQQTEVQTVVYPNPVEKSAHLVLGSEWIGEDSVLVQLISNNGSVFKQWQANGDVLQLDLTGASVGNYLLHISSSNKNKTLPLIKK